MKKNKTAYTHPKLAEYLRELFAKSTAYGWGGLDYHMEQAVPKTIEEMVANKELVIENNLIRLPQKKVKTAAKEKPNKKQPEGGCKKVVHQPAIKNDGQPKPHKGG